VLHAPRDSCYVNPSNACGVGELPSTRIVRLDLARDQPAIASLRERSCSPVGDRHCDHAGGATAGKRGRLTQETGELSGECQYWPASILIVDAREDEDEVERGPQFLIAYRVQQLIRCPCRTREDYGICGLDVLCAHQTRELVRPAVLVADSFSDRVGVAEGEQLNYADLSRRR